MSKKALALSTLGVLGALLILGYQSHSLAWQGLTIGGNSANFGVHRLAGGFTPDPKSVNVTSGGSLDVRGMNHGAGCVGYATSSPDVILNYASPASFLRIFFQPASNGAGNDTALVVNTPSGQWVCNDDAVGLNPQIDFNSPRAGQYDIWVTSYQAGTSIRGALKVTELSSVSVR